VIHFSPLGDRAILVRLGTQVDEPTHLRVRAACARLEASAIAGVRECVPTYVSVVVHYDPVRMPRVDEGAPGPYARLVASLTAALAGLREEGVAPARRVEIPVCYGDELGPDLGELAAHHGLAPDEVVRIHTAGDYLVHMVGFMPGFAYLGGLSERIAMPRRPVPRTTVPAGSVGIGGVQTGVYPLPSPGGWNLIGRTPVALFAPDRDPPTLLHIGDRVRFVPITLDEFREWSAVA
jgi:inhibitor of KinA